MRRSWSLESSCTGSMSWRDNLPLKKKIRKLFEVLRMRIKLFHKQRSDNDQWHLQIHTYKKVITMAETRHASIYLWNVRGQKSAGKNFPKLNSNCLFCFKAPKYSVYNHMKQRNTESHLIWEALHSQYLDFMLGNWGKQQIIYYYIIINMCWLFSVDRLID